MEILDKSFKKLRLYCEAEDLKGWDPYDGLNSRLFQGTKLKNWDIARLALIQLCKRSPVNLRPLLRVPKQHNAKGVALFLNGYCNLLKSAKAGITAHGTAEMLQGQVCRTADLLISLSSDGYSGACWGYNFGWQARRLFFFPPGTPTVVATSFAACALFEAYEVTGEKRFLDAAISAGEFVTSDLRRTDYESGVILSYSPIAGNDTVFNASLLGAKLLSYCYLYSKDEKFSALAHSVVSAACDAQQQDGSWVYGLNSVQSWKDSFHTGYNLDAIAHYRNKCGRHDFDTYLEKGTEFYLTMFFTKEGVPKYYHNKTYPIDIHCPGQLFVIMNSLKNVNEIQLIAEKVLAWTIRNMQDRRGYFYYQKKQFLTTKISYMRWSNAFMFNALSCYILDLAQSGSDC